LGLRIAEFADQFLVAGCLLDGIEIGALHVLDDGVFQRGLVVRLDDHDRHFVQSRLLRRAPAPLAGDDLVGVGAGPTHDDRLNDAALADRVGEKVEIVLAKGLAGVARIGTQESHRHPPLPARALDDRAFVAGVADQGREAAAEAGS
jgi:hypothetical protein